MEATDALFGEIAQEGAMDMPENGVQNE